MVLVMLRHLNFIVSHWKILVRGFRGVIRSNLEKKENTENKYILLSVCVCVHMLYVYMYIHIYMTFRVH